MAAAVLQTTTAEPNGDQSWAVKVGIIGGTGLQGEAAPGGKTHSKARGILLKNLLQTPYCKHSYKHAKALLKSETLLQAP